MHRIYHHSNEIQTPVRLYCNFVYVGVLQEHTQTVAKMNTQEHASVHTLELRKQPQEVYEAFYNLYGSEEFIDIDGSASHGILINGRVLHDDLSGNRNTHLIVRCREGVMLPAGRRQGQGDRVQHVFPYVAETFIVATTDGKSIDRWQTINAYGIHEGKIDTILNPYRPEREMVQLRLVNDLGNHAFLKFNMGLGYGMMTLPEDHSGWILDAADSDVERSRVLATASDIGHVATAS